MCCLAVFVLDVGLGFAEHQQNKDVDPSEIQAAGVGGARASAHAHAGRQPSRAPLDAQHADAALSVRRTSHVLQTPLSSFPLALCGSGNSEQRQPHVHVAAYYLRPSPTPPHRPPYFRNVARYIYWTLVCITSLLRFPPAHPLPLYNTCTHTHKHTHVNSSGEQRARAVSTLLLLLCVCVCVAAHHHFSNAPPTQPSRLQHTHTHTLIPSTAQSWAASSPLL